MKRHLHLAFSLVLAGLLLLGASLAGRADGGEVVLLQIKGGIGPATSDYIQRGLRDAARDGAPAVVIKIDTPGGLDAATRDINQAIIGSGVPVITWVAPGGARAASAGTYILYASHLAAMAPATSLGSATPVSIGGGDPGGRPPARPRPGSGEGAGEGEGDKAPAASDDPAPGEAQEGNAMSRKVLNDAVAYMRGLAQLRGRNVEFAEAAVRQASTLTAQEALEAGVIEILARDLDDLLAQADGREVGMGERGTPTTLATAGRSVRAVEPDWRNRMLAIITDPSIAYLLLLVGLYGLIFEGYSPGAIVPGVVGAISLLLAAYALQVLPVNYVGVALIVLGVGLMAAEMFVPSFGALGIGGIVALVVGSLMLFDTDVPGFGVPGQLVLGVGAASGLAFLGVLHLAMRARKRPVVTGVDELLGDPGHAIGAFQGKGKVRVRGEVWQAWSEQPVSDGQAVRVLAVDGLTLRVAPREPAGPA